MPARLTFLRRHVAQQRALRADSPNWEGLEVFRTLRRLPAVAAPSLLHFFRGSATLPPLYRPVPVELHPGDVRPGESERDDDELPSLLARLHAQKSREGILLFAPGGAGKSVALRKAFLDCLDAATALGKTGLVPCWLRLPLAPSEINLRDLFRHALEPDVPLADDGPVWDWLDSGPPVLLLCDLDDPRHVAPHCRPALAFFLAQLQGNERWRRRGHRIVVAYRSSGDLCLVARALLSSGHFRRHRLLELDPDAVASYLTDLSVWSAELAGTTAVPPDLTAWASFIQRMERRPLLMHLLGAFFDGLPDEEPTAARLIARLVEQQLTYALNQLTPAQLAGLPSHAPHNLRRLALTCLARAARLAWSLQQHTAPLPRQYLQDVIQDPEHHLPALPQSDYWRPNGFSPYWNNEAGLGPYLPGLVDLVCGSPWVSCPDEEFYLVGPEVFVNFFAAAVPVRYPGGYTRSPAPLADNDHWFDEVVALWRQHLDAWAGRQLHGRDAWQQGAALLAGLLSEGEFFTLVRAWLRGSDHRLLRLGEALLHGRHPADPPSPPQCLPQLLSRLREALSAADQSGFVSDPLTVCHELLDGELRQSLEAFAGTASPGGPT